MPQLEFRDGTREVPDHLADLMVSLEIHRLTYDQAIEAANQKLIADRLNEQVDQIIKNHFRVSSF